MEFFATSNTIPVHISDTQKGNFTILFLHGYLETLNVWDEFISLLSKISGYSFRFISIDLPGHGLSGTHPFSNTMDFCSDVVLGVLNKCCVDRCYIVGHSLGGYIGLKSLQKYPDRFISLSLFNSHPFPDLPEVYKDRDKEIFFITDGKLITLSNLVISNMFFKDNLRRMDDNIQSLLSNCETHDPKGIAASVRGIMNREDMSDFLIHYPNKIQAIQGDNDHYFSLNRINDFISSFPTVSTSVIHNTGHDSYLEEPLKVADSLLDFLKEFYLP